jgi:peptidoglycan/xylan/chitin deacetylase (PgdA/CDA1 family)
MTRAGVWIRTGALLLAGIGLAGAAVGAATALDSAVILQYEEIGEQIGDEAVPASRVTPAQFEQHLVYLEAAGYSVWPVEKIVAHLQTGIPLPERCVAITFDGAHTSVYDVAYPALLTRGWPFSIFVSTKQVDLYTPGRLTWEQMRMMRKVGVKFGTQGHSGTHLIRHSRGESEEDWHARVQEDISYCRGQAFEQLSQTTNFFAYPYGEYDPALREIVLGFRFIGLGKQPGAVWSGSDFGALPRFVMTGASASPEEFARRVASRPLPVSAAEPEDPVLGADETRPVLRLTLDPGDYAPETLTAFVQQPGDLELRWIDRESGILELQARDPLPIGRSLYNLSAPAAPGGRESLYSHLWIRGDRYPD